MNSEQVTDSSVCHGAIVKLVLNTDGLSRAKLYLYRWQGLSNPSRDSKGGQKKTKIKLTYKNSPHYNGTPHQKCHSTSVCWGAGHSGVTRGSRIFSKLFTVIVAQLSRARQFAVTVDSAPRTARRLYLGSWMSQRNSSLCVQSQSHLKLKDKPVCCLLPRSAGNTGRRIKRPSSLPVSGLSEQLNGKKWRHAGIQTERWEATGEWGDDAWVASG